MGKQIITAHQRRVIAEIKDDPYFREHFYFTGGTALSAVYFSHRYSEDLDFFSEMKFSKEHIIALVSQTSKRLGYSFTLRDPEGIHILIFTLDFGTSPPLKVDFNHYPYPRVEQGKQWNGLTVDSFRDIGANKLLCINQRTDVKDFVDLYFLMKRFSLWDHIYAVEAKFGMKMDTMMIAADCMKVETFDYLPKMLVPLTLKELKRFFVDQAEKIGRMITK